MQNPMTYPFSAIVALDDLKLSLILNAINPKIGGLLIRGPKGSGKTTAVRALADILPKIRAAEGCPFNCNPDDPSNMCEKCRDSYVKNGSLPFEEKNMKVVDLPLGATEDRVIGSLDVEKAIKIGVQALEPGILAQANQNILYVDEVNLLPDHIADDLLDSAATGWNVVEREGISVKHPSRFIFIGTMNPEEGHLRPQLLDRFALSVEANRISRAKDRIEIVKRNMEFEADPEGFLKKYSAYQEELKDRIVQAKKTLLEVKVHEKLLEAICNACLELKVDGMRPDIIIAKTAKTLAAFENQTTATSEHVIKAAELALSHRTREGGFLEPATPQEIRETLDSKIKEANFPEEEKKRTMEKIKAQKYDEEPPQDKKGKARLPPWGFGFRKHAGKKSVLGTKTNSGGLAPGSVFARNSNVENPRFLFDSKGEKGGKSAFFTSGTRWTFPKLNRGVSFLDKIRQSKLLPFDLVFKVKGASKHAASSAGKRAEAETKIHRGRARGWRVPHGKISDIHLPATIRTAARMQSARGKSSCVALEIHSEDIREKLRIYRAPMTVVFVLDLSESMLESIDDVKEALLKLHGDAYCYRDKVGMVAFKEMSAVVVQHPTANLRLVANKLLRLRMSGFTPLADGMLKALDVLKEAKRRDSASIPAMIVITDGETNVPFRRDLQTGEIREFDALDVSFFKYESEAINDVISISRMIKKERIYTVVINPSPTLVGLPPASGSITTKLIASMSGGMHYEVTKGIIRRGEKSSEKISETILEAQRRISQHHLSWGIS